MAGTEFTKKPFSKLKLLVDKEKNKVILVEARKDFVDVLFCLLALPMGTIVRLLEKNKQNPTIGCFNNLYKSVSNLSIDNFLSEACKDMLLYPRYVKEKQCRRLNIDDDEFIVAEDSCDELFISQRNSFTITEDMKVEFASVILTMEILTGLGYNTFDKMEEMFVDVNHEDVLSLLHCLFSKETPFTDVFLKKHSCCGITMPILPAQDGVEAGPTEEVMSLTLFVRKQDMKVLFAESQHDFVDLLFIFLAIPLESIWEITGSNIELGCIGNICKSLKNLSSSGGTNASSMLPWQYSFHKSLLGVCYKRNKLDVDEDEDEDEDDVEPTVSGRFVKRESTFLISDDLTTIEAFNLSSTFGLLKKLDSDFDEIEAQVISITGAEAINLLKASLMTSTPLTTAFGNLLLKKPEVERV